MLPETLGREVTRDNVALFERFAASLARAHPESLFVSRVGRAIGHFRARGRVGDVARQLADQSDADAVAVDSSYGLVRTFVWAIPILGFIGTVTGIGAAVSGFSDSVASAVDLDVMQQSIGSVTTGLGVAFDTTLLALVISVLINVPASSLQKAEEDVLLQIDRYCRDELLTRFDDGAGPAAPADTRELEAQIGRLAAAIDALDRRLG